MPPPRTPSRSPGALPGVPADFRLIRGGGPGRGRSTSLLAAWSPNSNTKALTYQVRPVELLALLISFVVAGKTAETDYIFITGTDAWGAAQTEAINVSAGNGATSPPNVAHHHEYRLF